MQEGKSYIKDTGDFINKLRQFGEVPEGALLVTADLVGLYPSIPHEDGLKALKKRLNGRVSKKVPTSDLVSMAEFVLKNNYFEFGQTVKHQTSGTAIGTKFAPPYACIFMDWVETEFLAGEEHKPWMWVRYIDDIFFVWTHGREKLDFFLERLNKFHHDLKYTWEISGEHVKFLDLVVSVSEGRFVTDLYCKPTDCHQFLHYGSCHPGHMKKSTVYSQTLRIKRICTREEDFVKHQGSLRNWFLNRGYPRNLIETQFQKVSDLKRDDLLFQKGEKKTGGGVPLVLDFHPNLSNVGSIMRRLYTLY